jgi:hypothetical protein
MQLFYFIRLLQQKISFIERNINHGESNISRKGNTMDYSNLVTSLIILVYGILTYRRRETEHRLTIIRLRKGIELPQQDSKPEAFKLWTTGGVAILLLGCTLGALFPPAKIRYAYDVLLGFAIFFFSGFTLLLMVLIRDIKAYHQHK